MIEIDRIVECKRAVENAEAGERLFDEEQRQKVVQLAGA